MGARGGLADKKGLRRGITEGGEKMRGFGGIVFSTGGLNLHFANLDQNAEL